VEASRVLRLELADRLVETRQFAMIIARYYQNTKAD